MSIPWAGELDLATLGSRREAARRLRRILIRLHPRVIAERLAEIQRILDVAPLRESSVLGWDDLRRLTKEGVVFCSHTRGHCSMMTLTDEEVVEEIDGSQEDLERELGSVWRAFAFPYGHNDRRTAALLKNRGFVAAFSASPGRNPIPDVDRFWLFRQCVGPGHSVSRVQLGLSGFYPVGMIRLRAAAWLQERRAG
jgi:peptidoglycan/xylan/chitin deacetylase (PgdA/CDA1 family)